MKLKHFLIKQSANLFLKMKLGQKDSCHSQIDFILNTGLGTFYEGDILLTLHKDYHGNTTSFSTLFTLQYLKHFIVKIKYAKRTYRRNDLIFSAFISDSRFHRTL